MRIQAGSYIITPVYWNEEDKVDRDVTVFVKYDPKQCITRYHHYSSLLTLRFHKKSAQFPKTGTDAHRLLEALEQCLNEKDGRLERRRTCGSSGRLSYSKEFMHLLSTHNSCPKIPKAALWLPGLDEKWHLIYNNTSEGLTKEVYYSNPVRGGQFEIDTDLFMNYPFYISTIQKVFYEISHKKL